MPSRIGVFGGTFDPLHHGHLIVAAQAYDQLRLDELILVPTAIPPHKDATATPADLRLEMVRAAIAGDARFRVDDLEVRRGGRSYTVETLREFKRRHPEAELFFLLGADQYAGFGSWRDPEGILECATLAVMDREGETPRANAPYHAVSIEVSRIDISSTTLRERVSRGDSIRYFVPDAVTEVIAREGLYRAAEPRGT